MWNEIKSILRPGKTSRELAKGRLHLVLAHDRAGIEGAKLQELRREVAAVIAKYVAIDPDSVEIQIDRLQRGMSTQLTVSSPLKPRASEP
ncbi:MAG TPA: cell division topological specificity factor MinE [Kofleriaceae bacterium]|jgi:cell division topological specificity factor|nr:cell division topological specificity factor MinE [Kofleriaceae bacterium]